MASPALRRCISSEVKLHFCHSLSVCSPHRAASHRSSTRPTGTRHRISATSSLPTRCDSHAYVIAYVATQTLQSDLGECGQCAGGITEGAGRSGFVIDKVGCGVSDEKCANPGMNASVNAPGRLRCERPKVRSLQEERVWERQGRLRCERRKVRSPQKHRCVA